MSLPGWTLRNDGPRAAGDGRVRTRLRTRRRILAAGSAALAGLLTGCGGGPQSAAPAAPSSQVRPRSTAHLTILSPEPGDTISGKVMHVRLALAGAVIVPQTSTHLTPDRGHVHLLVDGRVVSMAYGLEQDVPVTRGPHLLQAEFVATDHFPFNPRVIATVTFTDR